MAQTKIKEVEASAVYHASERSFARNERVLLDLIASAVDDKAAEAHKLRLSKLRARKRAKFRVLPKDDSGGPVLDKPIRRDPLSKMGERYYRIGELLRDHAEGVSIGSVGDMIGFTDGSKNPMSYTQPEAFAASAFRGRMAWDRFIEGCVDCGCDESARECVKVVLQRKSITQCLADLGIAPTKKPSTRQVDNFKAILCGGLDEAGAYLGVN